MDPRYPGFVKEGRVRDPGHLALFDLERPVQEFRTVVHGCTGTIPLRSRMFAARRPLVGARHFHPVLPIR